MRPTTAQLQCTMTSKADNGKFRSDIGYQPPLAQIHTAFMVQPRVPATSPSATIVKAVSIFDAGETFQLQTYLSARWYMKYFHTQRHCL